MSWVLLQLLCELNCSSLTSIFFYDILFKQIFSRTLRKKTRINLRSESVLIISINNNIKTDNLYKMRNMKKIVLTVDFFRVKANTRQRLIFRKTQTSCESFLFQWDRETSAAAAASTDFHKKVSSLVNCKHN